MSAAAMPATSAAKVASYPSVRASFVELRASLPARRRWRRAGDPRLSEADRELLRRVTRGDLADAFQEALDADLDADPLLGGHPTDNDDG